MDVICGPLALRLAKLIGGLHFQVAERTLQLWNSDRFTSLVVKSGAHRSTILGTLFPVLHRIQCVPPCAQPTLVSPRPHSNTSRPPPQSDWSTGTRLFARRRRRFLSNTMTWTRPCLRPSSRRRRAAPQLL